MSSAPGSVVVPGADLYPPNIGGTIWFMTTTYLFDLRIIDHVDNEGAPCTHCQLEDATVQAQAYLVFSVAFEGQLLECCLACLIPALDSTPYLDTDRPIVVEVARSATKRPF